MDFLSGTIPVFTTLSAQMAVLILLFVDFLSGLKASGIVWEACLQGLNPSFRGFPFWHRQRPDRKEESAGMDDGPSGYGDAQDATNADIRRRQECRLSTGREVHQDWINAIRANTNACMQRQQGEGNISIRSREGELIGHGSPDDTYSEGIRMERNRPDREQEPHPQSREGLFGRNDAGGYWAEWPTQPPLCTRDDGLSERLVGITFSKWREGAIRALGNAIVPQVAFEVFRAINQVK